MLWGRVIFFREVQPLKVLPSVITTPSGRFIVVRASAPLKVAGWVIFLRLLGSTISVSLSQPFTMLFSCISSTPSENTSLWRLSIFCSEAVNIFTVPGITNSSRSGNTLNCVLARSVSVFGRTSDVIPSPFEELDRFSLATGKAVI